MSVGKSTMPLADAFQWMVIPHGRTPSALESTERRTQRITLRVIPQITRDSISTQGKSFRVGDIKRSVDTKSVTNWPSFAHGIRSIAIGYAKPGSSRQGSSNVERVTGIAAAYEQARRQHGCSMETAERLWRALIHRDLGLTPLPSSCVPDAGAYVQAQRLKALQHATGATLLKTAIGQMYSNGLAMSARGSTSGVYKRQVAAEVTVTTTGRMESAIEPLLQMIGTIAPVGGDVHKKQKPAPRVPGAEWAIERLDATGFQFSGKALDLVATRIEDWTRLTGRDVGNGPNGEYALDDFIVDRMLATTSDLRRLDGVLNLPKAPTAIVQEADTSEETNEFHREIGKLTFHPWLLQALGLAIDLEIPEPQFPEDPAALYVASVDHELGEIIPHVQCRVVTSSRAAWLPEEDKSRNAEHDYFHGCVRLARKTPQNESLYVLEQFDIDAATEKLVLLAQNLHSQFEAGVAADDREAVLSSLRTTGISLLRRRPSQKDDGEAQRLRRKQDQARSTCVVDLYAEDLIVGYRPDMSLLAPDQFGRACRGPWKSLVGRELQSVKISRGVWPVTLSPSPRDEAIITPHARIPGKTDVPSGSPSRENVILPIEELFCWRGWNLAVRSAESADTGNENAQESRETLIPTYVSRGALPKQRFAWGYRVGMRAVYTDGKSLSLEEATHIYDDERHIDCTLGTDHVGDQLAASNGGPAQTHYYTPFFRYEPVTPPDIHLAKPLDRSKAPTARAEHAVVASDAFGNVLIQSTERVLVPPRVDLELAIRAGAFDQKALRHSPPRGAFPNVELNPDGSFPAVGRNCIANLFGSRDGGETAYVESSTASRPLVPYLPDPWATRTIIGIYRRADDQLLALDYFDYYDTERAWPDCRALRIRFEANVKEATPPIGFDTEWHKDTLVLKVPPGTALTLRFWHEMDEVRLSASGVVEAMAAWLKGKSAAEVRQVLDLSISDCCQDGLSDMRDRLVKCLSRWHERFPYDLRPYVIAGRPARDINLTSFSMLNPARTVQVTHAVPIPARAPRFSDAQDVGTARARTLPLTQGVISVRFDVDRRQRGATVAQFLGDIELHRASTARLDCLADWDEYTDEIGTHWQKTNQQRQMFSIDSISGVLENPPLFDKSGSKTFDEGKRAELPQDNDLLLLKGNREVIGRSRNQDMGETFKHYDFGDAKARQVNFRLRATSRFTNDVGPTAPGRFRESGPATSRWIPATLPPERPDVAFVVPLFETAREATSNTFKQRRRGGWFRIWLERPWFSSGQGELLALVCWPEELFRPRGGSADFLRDKTKQAWGTLTGQNNAMPTPLVPLYTGWGLDPIWEQGRATLNYIPPGAFANRLNAGLRTAVPSQFFDGHAGDPAQFAMALALYEPVYDETEKRWYADIHIVPDENVYFPFVRLGLARYQPNAIKSCELSEIVTSEFIQLVPDRSATIQIDRRSAVSKVRVTVAGVQAMGPAYAEGQKAAPRMIFRMDQGVAGFASEENPAWLPLREAISGAEELELIYDAKRHVWSRETEYDLETQFRYSAYLEEQEAFLVDEHPDAPQIGNASVSWRVVYADRVLLQSRP